MQLRNLVLVVLPRAEQLSLSHEGLGDQAPGEVGEGVFPQV